jgi:hypothetical protein
MSKLKTRLPIAALSALGALLLLPAAGQAATEFGSRLNHDPANSGECETLPPADEPGDCTIVSLVEPEGTEGNPNAGGSPVDGVVTKFRLRAYIVGKAAQVTFVVANINRPDPNDETSALATVAATGPTVTLPVNGELTEAPVQEFAARVPIKKGQHLGVDTSPSLQATVNDSGDKFSYVFAPPLVAGSGARGSLEPTGQLLLSARVEPDADNDGFGDETQDQCPTQATTQGPCDTTPPGVTGLKVNGGKVQYSLSEAATVSFQLEKKAKGRKVGGKCVKQTASNKKKKACPLFKKMGAAFSGPGAAGPNKAAIPNGKKLKPGTYRLTMTARDVAGNTTTQTTTFTIKKKKKKK